MGNRDIIQGPAVVEYNGQLFYSEGQITLASDFKPRTMTSSVFGSGDRRITDKLFILSFTPIGMMDDNALKYYPWSHADIGKLLAPATDLPVVIWTSAGEKISIPAGVVISPPTLALGTDRGPMGAMTIACMGDLTKEDAAADAHYTITTASVSAHTQDWSQVKTPAYKLTLGGDTPTVIDGIEGYAFDLRPAVSPAGCNRYGTVNYRLDNLDPVITCRPAYQSEVLMMDLLNIQGASAATLGGSMALGRTLTLEPAGGSGVTVEFADCLIESGSMIFGASDPRHGDYAFLPVYTAGSALYTITFPDLTPAE